MIGPPLSPTPAPPRTRSARPQSCSTPSRTPTPTSRPRQPRSPSGSPLCSSTSMTRHDSPPTIPASPPPPQRPPQAIAYAQQADNDPLAAAAGLETAEATLDDLLAPVRAAAAEAEKARVALSESLGRVTSRVKAVSDFIETRRGAVGAEARTRLSEAARHLDRAQQTLQTDPSASLEALQKAEAFVNEAEQLAQNDVGNWERSQRQTSGGCRRRTQLDGPRRHPDRRTRTWRRWRRRSRRHPQRRQQRRRRRRRRTWPRQLRRRRHTCPSRWRWKVLDRSTAPEQQQQHGQSLQKVDETMAKKQSILGRIGQLTRANINSLLDKAEDPEKMLDQLVRDYTSSIAEAEEAVAQTIGNLRLAEADHAEDIQRRPGVGRQGPRRLAEGRLPAYVGHAGRGRQVRRARQDRARASRSATRTRPRRPRRRSPRRTRSSRSSRPA